MDIEAGKGIKDQLVDKVLSKLSRELVDGEVPWFMTKCNNFKPMVDVVLLTNARVLGVSSTEGTAKYKAALHRSSPWTMTKSAATWS
ncbi:MAG: hypothetical protein ABJA86_13775 [Nocardioidaceae bacterium]